MSYGIDRIYSPDDGRELGLQGMIDDLVHRSDFATGKDVTAEDLDAISFENSTSIARIISAVENFSDENLSSYKPLTKSQKALQSRSSVSQAQGSGKIIINR